MEEWSSCSVKDYEDYLNTGLFSCLNNKPSYPITPPLCGDGLVQGDEDCDCGPPNFCENPCCDPNTCKFVANATCAIGLCCDTNVSF